MTTVKVGDVVAWADVPDGALVRFGIEVALRYEGEGFWCTEGYEWLGPECEPKWWSWDNERTPHAPCTIVALGLTGKESAAELRRLAEVFEVREGWCEMSRGNLLNLAEAMAYDAQADDEEDGFFEHLHGAGWRPGMSAEDADRLLAERA